jgi:hypothetical protein
MTRPNYVKLKGITHAGELTLSEQLPANIVAFFDYALLEVGAFFNVNIPTSGAFGGNQHRLRLVSDPNFDTGCVWEGFRQNWVSGVYVNGTFYPKSTTGAYSHYIDYPHGRVVFLSPISTSSTVTCEYSYRWFNFSIDEIPWFRQIQFNSLRLDSEHFLQVGSGDWNILSQNRVQLPAVVVEASPNRKLVPKQIGGGQKIYNEVLFHIFAETPWEKQKLVDWITYQNEKSINTFNLNLMAEQDKSQLTASGTIHPSGYLYPELVAPTSDVVWRKATFLDMTGFAEEAAPPLYRATVRSTVWLDFPEL